MTAMTQDKRVPISFEFFPPNTPVGDEKLKTVVLELGATKPEFFSVTYGAGGSTREKTFNTVMAIAAAGFEAAPHLSCVGATRESLQEILAGYRAQNIHRIVALRGDMPSGTHMAGDFRVAADLVRFIRETQGADWHIEVAAYPEYHPEQRYAARDLAHYAKIAQFAMRDGIEIPRWVALKMEGYMDDVASIRAFGIDVVSALCEKLIAGGAPGLHFYTMNQSAVTLEICKRLGA